MGIDARETGCARREQTGRDERRGASPEEGKGRNEHFADPNPNIIVAVVFNSKCLPPSTSPMPPTLTTVPQPVLHGQHTSSLDSRLGLRTPV
jgi:hypothetical protein